MPAHNFTNTANKPTLTTAVSGAATSLSVGTLTGWPSAPCWAMIARGTASAEMVEVTAITGTTLTVTRGMDGTLASAHSVGDLVELVVPAVHFTAEEVHTNAVGAVHGVTGAVVGTTDIQSLTQKMVQGGHKSVYSDANPAGLAASFESVADTNAARDGFVHRSTAGDVNRRGLYLEQSGTARVEAYNDGTLKFTPNSASARGGLEVNATAANTALQITNATNANAITLKALGDGTLSTPANFSAQAGLVTSNNFGGNRYGMTSQIAQAQGTFMQSLRQPWVAKYLWTTGQYVANPYPTQYSIDQTINIPEDGWISVRIYLTMSSDNGLSNRTEVSRGFFLTELRSADNLTSIEVQSFEYHADVFNDNVVGKVGRAVVAMEELYTNRQTAGNYILRIKAWKDTALGFTVESIRMYVTPVVRLA